MGHVLQEPNVITAIPPPRTAKNGHSQTFSIADIRDILTPMIIDQSNRTASQQLGGRLKPDVRFKRDH